MKITVLSRGQVKRLHKKDAKFHKSHWFISIFSSEIENQKNSYSPLPDGSNILKLKFDDVTEKDFDYYIHFNKDMAKRVINFIKNIKDDGTMDFIVHCDAGVSRSGAIGYMLNEYFNKFLKRNQEDIDFFNTINAHIMPNPEVTRILKQEMFGNDYSGVFVNNYEYNEDGERINHIKEI